jgi:superfamily II DNA/RNA helicase
VVLISSQRELATQTYENIQQWTAALERDHYPQLRTLLCIGGISMSDQSHTLSQGIHIVVATPGRLIDMLEKKKINFDGCKYMCMDEADRMIDLGFEDDVRTIMSFFKASLNKEYAWFRANSTRSANARLCSSPQRCRGKSKILLSSPSSALFLST